MNDTIDYIDDYFNHVLAETERQAFEARCSRDEAFAQEVAFYITAKSAAREALLQQKKEQWKPMAETKDTIAMKPVKKANVLRWMPYAAAACVIFAVAFYFLFYQPTPQRLAADYLKDKYGQLNQNMDGDDMKDSVQLGIAAYNNNNYNRAVALFEWAKANDSTNSDAKKYAGLAHLQLNEYEKALQCFKELSTMKIRYNAGDILQANVLLQRNEKTDKEEAKKLLEKVIREKEQGSDLAAAILKK